MPAGRFRVAVIFFTVLIDLIGFGIVIPILPGYAVRFGAHGFEFGALLGVYSLMQFFAAAVLGRLSDRVGRRPVLLTTMVLNTGGYLLFAFAGSYWALFASRVIGGVSGGDISAAAGPLARSPPPPGPAAAADARVGNLPVRLRRLHRGAALPRGGGVRLAAERPGALLHRVRDHRRPDAGAGLPRSGAAGRGALAGDPGHGRRRRSDRRGPVRAQLPRAVRRDRRAGAVPGRRVPRREPARVGVRLAHRAGDDARGGAGAGRARTDPGSRGDRRGVRRRGRARGVSRGGGRDAARVGP